MKWTPRNYQQEIMEFVMDVPRGNVWADMGTGKTSSILSALDLLWLAGSRFYPALVLGPVRVARDVWHAEAAKWDHLRNLRVQPITGRTPAERAARLARKADIYCCNYENVPWLVSQFGKDEWPFKIVVADESTRLKSFRLRKGGKRAAALSKVSAQTGRWVNLTGTPAPNGLIDVWGQSWFLDHGRRLGQSYTAFKDRWFKENQYTRKITPMPHAEREITTLLSDITISLKAKDYLDLPPIIENTIEVELPDRARRLYNQLEDELAAELEGGRVVEALTAAAKTQKCMQLTAGFLYHTKGSAEYENIHDAKLDALLSIVNEQAGAPLIVVYYWKADLLRIKDALNLRGRTRKDVRELVTAKDMDDWNAGKVKVLLVHEQSAGHGLNLQFGGNAMAFFSPYWDAETRAQVIERIGPARQLSAGFNRPTIVHNIVARHSVDEDVMARHRLKISAQDALRDGVTLRRMLR